MISGIIKFEVSVISRAKGQGRQHFSEALIIPDITKTESSNNYITILFNN